MKKMEQVDQSVRVELSHTDRFDRPMDLLTSIHPPTHRVLDVAPVRQPAPQRALSLAPVQRRVIPQPQRVLRCGIVRQLAVLDVGCGWAYLCVCVWLGGCRYVSVDYGVCYVRLSGRDGSIDRFDRRARTPRAAEAEQRQRGQPQGPGERQAGHPPRARLCGRWWYCRWSVKSRMEPTLSNEQRVAELADARSQVAADRLKARDADWPGASRRLWGP